MKVSGWDVIIVSVGAVIGIGASALCLLSIPTSGMGRFILITAPVFILMCLVMLIQDWQQGRNRGVSK